MATLSGGDKLVKILTDINKNVEKSTTTLSVGFLEGSTYPDGTSTPLVAAVQEFGSPSRNIPPRPFFRNMIARKHNEWPSAVAELLKANNYNVTKTLMQTGEGIKGQLQQSIRDTNSPPLAPATIARKGFDKPLIDTGHMINSIDYKVE